MTIYSQNGISVDFADSRLEIRTDVLQILVENTEGSITANGKTWYFKQPMPVTTVSAEESDNNGRSAPHLRLTLKTAEDREVWSVFPSIPLFCTDCHPDDRVFLPHSPHLQITAVELVDRTDHNDSLVMTDTRFFYRKYAGRGNLFLMEDAADESGLLLVKHAPGPDSAVRRAPEDLYIDSKIHLCGCRYGAAYGVGSPGELFAAYRRLYAALCCQPEVNFIMSNTWGDRSRDAAMREDFVLRELDCAAHLGVDIVQLDDGWQKGISSNSAYAKDNKGGVFEGFYAFDPDFWNLDPVKFPGGMDVILEKAKSLGIEMGLWFAPDSSDDFTNWQKDVEAIRTLVEKHGARYIKLDGVILRSELCEANYIAMLDAISTLDGGKLRFNLDITNNERLGYFCGIPYGTLFVENRYTDWKNYYPHNTFRNLWQLSRYIPAKKLQMEVLNPRRNAELYGDDPLAPDTYDIDWCFASVMAANPLIWMEMQHLNPADTESLRNIITVYRKHRYDMAKAQVNPIGEIPNGVHWSGFQWDCGDGSGYLVLLRGITEQDTYTYSLPLRNKTYEILHTNTDTDITETAEGLQTTLEKKRGYVFLRYSRA